METRTKKSAAQKALDLVKKWFGVVVPEGDGWRFSVTVVGRNGREYILSWDVQTVGGKESVVGTHVVSASEAKAANPYDDYRPGSFFDTLEAAIKYLLHRDGADSIEDVRLVVKLRMKRQAGFRWEAEFDLSRFCNLEGTHVSIMNTFQLSATVQNQFVHVALTLDTEDALRMAKGFLDGTIPAQVILDWLHDSQQVGEKVDRMLNAQAGERPSCLGKVVA